MLKVLGSVIVLVILILVDVIVTLFVPVLIFGFLFGADDYGVYMASIGFFFGLLAFQVGGFFFRHHLQALMWAWVVLMLVLNAPLLRIEEPVNRVGRTGEVYYISFFVLGLVFGWLMLRGVLRGHEDHHGH